MRGRTAVGVLALLLASCGGPVTDRAPAGTGTTSSTINSAVTSTTVNDLPMIPRPSIPRLDPTLIPDWFVDEGPLPDELDQLARSIIAEAKGIGADELIAAASMFVTWNDSSLGCAQPGQQYLQVLTDGYLAYYQAGESLYRVHTDTGANVVLCELPSVPGPQPRS